MADAVELARTLAAIVSRTRDPDTAQELMVVVHQLFTEAGLPATKLERPVQHLGVPRVQPWRRRE